MSALKKSTIARHLWLMPIIRATQKAEIRRITVQSQPRGNSSRDPISKIPITRAGGVAPSEGPKLNPVLKKKKNEYGQVLVVHACNPRYLGG
jgi:hypothetical protein